MGAMPPLIEKLLQYVSEDIGFGDITTEALVEDDIITNAEVISKESCVIAGISIISSLFTASGCKVKKFVKDGQWVTNKQKILHITGTAITILQLERTSLNLIGRMSGIATDTRTYVEKIENAGLKTRIASTRKTAPGLSQLDKAAVKMGGGDTHRLRLDDAIMIKDNHMKLVGSVAEALEKAKSTVSFTKKMEIEVSSLEEAIEAAQSGVDIIMLDNMSPRQVDGVISELKNRGLRNSVILESSGRINLENLIDYAKTGIDVVSIGALTHSSRSVDLSLELVR